MSLADIREILADPHIFSAALDAAFHLADADSDGFINFEEALIGIQWFVSECGLNEFKLEDVKIVFEGFDSNLIENISFSKFEEFAKLTTNFLTIF
ncbi:unnamed protein product [Blepharisma stoltei]|uniref:Calmodulin n=1 Tax=Blepharisma stoltei TaxID=1481888 RepID=A0AAU9JWH5_9CILI|nr:unnamed protein product [Blepharisma stoltei]